MSTKQHWETVYKTKKPNEVSWTQDVPKVSLDIIRKLNLPKNASIIDIGGGDSTLVDFLLTDGYTNITVLDISAVSIEKAKDRLTKNADKITWIVQDINDFEPTQTYDVWHDRATFHFLTQENEIANYVEKVNNSVTKHLLMATFSENGPIICSDLPIKQYSITALQKTFAKRFIPINIFNTDHITPFETKQNFTFAHFINDKK